MRRSQMLKRRAPARRSGLPSMNGSAATGEMDSPARRKQEETMNDQSIQISELSESPALPVPRASFLQRFAAYFVDTMILGLVTGCLGSFFGVIGSAARGGPWSDMAGAIGLGIPAAYFFCAYSTDGQTVGKRILKIKVVSRDGSPQNWRKGLLRTVGYFLSSLP